MIKKISHIGVAVRSLEESIPFYRDTLGMRLQGVEEVAGFRVRVAMFAVGASKIELLEPTCEESFLTEFLEQHGSGIHHIAYEVEDLVAAISELTAKGVAMIDAVPRQGAHGAKVAFLHPENSQFICTELCQTGEAV